MCLPGECSGATEPKSKHEQNKVVSGGEHESAGMYMYVCMYVST